MIVKSEFKIDLFQLKHTREPALLLEHIKADNAKKLGLFIAERIPYTKNEEKSFNGELPEMSLNREHQYNDQYELELMVLTRTQWQNVLHYLHAIAQCGMNHEVNRIIEIANETNLPS